MLMEQGCSGTILTSINKEDFLRITLPDISIEVQNDIRKNIIESYELRSQSKALLEQAKMTIEIAIESGEEKAIGFLQ